ncbi:glycosyltransferase family 9 protein [Halomonas sp. PAMB 3232]|uniref:glycosyltransferase family 9 protein n=1 Tax=Halomonas sp. PAMB 3232 TaxID=3075221 RepID=UPI00289D432A|nr:glycosyltransferase family 9 protein [Halomonas sp. PAMB 3232]WNL38926.1 glycosyltransferase family 9 protein [Halomonas sp. PAMB 3232]
MAQKVLVVRNDKIGDFMLAWPALACLKSASPTPHVSVLVPAYTEALARACPWVDEVIVDPGKRGGKRAQKALLDTVKAARFDALLTLFSTPRVGLLGWRAGIPLRLAPATKWAQMFYNARVTQRRSRSEKPEYQYNVDLACRLLARLSLKLTHLPAPPFWPLEREVVARQRQALMTGESSCAVVVHPGSGGSAVNLSLEQYAALIVKVNAQTQAAPAWWVSAGPGEEAQADALIQALGAQGIAVSRLAPSAGVEAFAYQLAGADLLIAGSTGPLHIAGCLNIATAGFYPARRSATPLRWQTCNDADKRLAFSPPSSAGEQEMTAIELDAAAGEISALLDTLLAAHPERGVLVEGGVGGENGEQ